MLITILSVVDVITSVVLVMLVLLHKGKGGGVSSMFGGGISSSLAGSTVVEKNLDRLTVTIALIWTGSIVALNLLLKDVA